MCTLHRRAAAAAATLVVGTAGVLGATAAAPAQARSASQSPAASLPGCTAKDLAVSLGRLDAGAGQRYQDVRIANVSDHACRLTGYPTFRFESGGKVVGFRSQHQGMAARRVTLQVGDSAWSTLWHTDPGPVPAADCAQTQATSLRMRLPARPHVYRVLLSAPVCTTEDYRPVAYPVRDRAVF